MLPALTITLLAILVICVLHFWWRRKFLRAQSSTRRELEELKQLQKEAAFQTETQQEVLLNSMVEGLLLLDESGRIQLANRAFVSLFELHSDVRGKTILEALRIHELAGLVDRMATGEQLLGHELRLPGPGERWVQTNAASISNGDGRRFGTLLVFHDLTRIKKLERTREEFVANVSHELRTPLSLIKGYAETLLDGAKDNPEVAGKFLQTIDRNAERLRLLIDDLLTISELESGRVKLNSGPIRLQPLVEKMFEDLKARPATKKINFLNQLLDLTVLADADRLEQVLGNLIDNAIKYGRPEGTVIAGGRNLEDGQIEIFIRDDGRGIPSEALERIFERFYRVDKARSREQGGTGLGLSIVKHIIQNHGGRVWAVSEIEKGSTFFFTLPRA
jgi:two-component system phosphate regulon sensor histidine kinase PhoR